MTAILGYVDLLAEAPGPAGRERYVERLRDRAESVTALGEQIRHIEQAFEEEHRVKFAVDPAAVVQAVCAQHRAERPDATLRFDAPPEVRTVFADGLLERAVDAVIEKSSNTTRGRPSSRCASSRSTTGGSTSSSAATDLAPPSGSGRY